MADELPDREADEPDSPDAQVIVLREGVGPIETVENTPDARARARAGAQERKAIFDYRTVGAKARAGKLPRMLTAAFAAGATNMMLAKILQEELVPASAKEAAEVAKITHGIYKDVTGGAAGNANLTPAEREQRLSEADSLHQTLAARAEAATTQLGGAPNADEDVEALLEDDRQIDKAGEPVVWEHDDDPD